MAFRPFARYIVVIKERFVTLAVCASHNCLSHWLLWRWILADENVSNQYTVHPQTNSALKLTFNFIGYVTTLSDCRFPRSIPQAASSVSLVSSVSAFRKLRDERSAPQREPDAFPS
jgi:hypothetical protein